jgi:hypothetical protein
MKIVIFASCNQKKSTSHPNQPTCKDLYNKEQKHRYLHVVTEHRVAKNMFRGALNISLNQAIRLLREFFDVKYYIISAGYGILEENEEIAPYDCSFQMMSDEEIKTRAEMLQIPDDYQKIIDSEQPDFLYLPLNRYYLLTIENWDKKLECKTIAYNQSSNPNVITLPEEHILYMEGESMGGLPIYGGSSFKDDLLLLTTRYLRNSADPVAALKDLLDNPDDLIYTMSTIRKNLQ